MKRALLSLVVTLCVTVSFAQPATPEPGMRWVVYGATSDEFNKGFNEEKWSNNDPDKWRGRAPGFFMPESTVVKDGLLKITVDILDEPIEYKGQTFTHRGGHVDSKNLVFPGSYLECSMKANKTFMSSTFWMITDDCDSPNRMTRVTELDVHESIGYPFDNPKAHQMGSNTHSRQLLEGSTIKAGSAGNQCEIGSMSYDGFHTYAVWWKSPLELLFYLDGEYKYTIVPASDFDIPMEVRMVCETYNWSPVPEDGGMTGTLEERTSSYDWVRTYVSLPIDKAQSKEKDKDNKIFEEKIELVAKSGDLNAIYTSAKGGKATLVVKDGDKVIMEQRYDLYSGNGNIPIDISSLKSGKYSASITFNKQMSSANFGVN